VLILSHGNSFAERGFSIHKKMLIENLSFESIITERQVYDAIEYHKGIEEIEVDKNMIHAARNVHGYYIEALKKEERRSRKGKILRREHEGRVLWCSKIFKNLTGKTEKSVWKTWKSEGK